MHDITYIVLVPRGSCTWDVVSFARSAWTQIQMLKYGCSPEYYKHSWDPSKMLPQEWQGHEAAPPLSQGVGREVTQEMAAGMSLPGLSFQGNIGRNVGGHAALIEHHHLLFKVNQVVILSYSLLLGFLDCIWMQETWWTPWKTYGSRSDLYLGTLCLTPCSLWSKPECDMSWSSDSSRYFSFRGKTVTQWIFKSFPCEPSTLLSKHSAFS